MTTGTLHRAAALREIASPDAAERGRAARQLARWDDVDVVKALAAALTDADRGVCDAAASSLLMIGTANTVEFLLPLLRSDHPGTRNRAGSLLEQLGKAEPRALIRLSSDPDPRMRLFAANIIAGTGDHDLAPRLIELMKDADVNVQDAAVVGLGRMRASSAVPALRDRLRASDPWACFSTIDALGTIGSPEALRALLDGAQAADPQMRSAYIDAAAATGLPEAAAGLLDLLSRFIDAGPLVAKALLGPLAHTLADPRFNTPGLAALLADGLARATPEDILRALSAPELPIRAAAIEAARVRAIPEAAPALSRLRSDPDSKIRTAAGTALNAFERTRKERL